MNGPNPHSGYPIPGLQQICFVKNTITNPKIQIGEYTYYADPADASQFEQNVLYHYPDSTDRLIIGKFCALAHQVRFIMNGANHLLTGFSTYPFYIFGNGWEKAAPKPGDLTDKGDTLVGNDVWIGYDSLIMPGVRIGNGAIIAARSVVVRDVAPYTIVGGNPAKTIKARFPPETVAGLESIAWWDWPIEKVTTHLEAIVSADLEKLRAIATEPLKSRAE